MLCVYKSKTAHAGMTSHVPVSHQDIGIQRSGVFLNEKSVKSSIISPKNRSNGYNLI